MIGSAENARRIATLSGEVLPPGWRLLATGSTRTVYLGPDGVVYKVENGSMDSEDANRTEFETFETMRSTSLPPGWRLAPSNLYVVDDKPILAMEHIQGTHEVSPHGALHEYDDDPECTLDCEMRGQCYHVWVADIGAPIGLHDLARDAYIVKRQSDERIIIDYAQ